MRFRLKIVKSLDIPEIIVYHTLGMNKIMSKAEILRLLAEKSPEIKKHGVSKIAIFGSAARDEMSAGSDIDILVEFDRQVGLFQFARLKMRLEEILGAPVDLVTEPALKKQLRTSILQEAVYAG